MKYIFIYLLVLPIATQAQQLSYKLRYDKGRATSIGLPWESKDKYEVRIQGQPKAIFGNYKLSQDTLWFSPLLAFNAKLTYQVYHDGQVLNEFRPKQHLSSPPTVNIFPSTDTVPVNILKMHLVFSQPMQVGRALEHISVWQADSLIQPFLELKPELWNEDHNILTLWLDPGRIKRGLLRQEQLGVPLLENQKYTIKVDPNWQSKAGQPIGYSYRKTFYTSTAIRQALSTEHWELSPPQSLNAPFTLQFNQNLDYLLLFNAIYVYSGDKKIAGNIALENGGQNWVFKPKNPWKLEQEYELIIEPRLEDLAGNNLKHAFDHPVGKGQEVDSKPLIFIFTPKSP